MTVYGIYWTREGVKPGEYVDGDEIDWVHDEEWVRSEFERREDKYWPSVLFSVEITNMQVVEEGACPWENR